MTDMIKAHFVSDGTDIRFSLPIAKVDEERRTVSGFATLDNVDRQGDKLTPESSREAFTNFRGNVRLMHQPIPAGKVISFRENSYYDPKTAKTYRGIYVDAYISKGADNIWQMVLDGTLTGFSIGGRIMEFENSVDEETGEDIRLVKKYELMELSLVDSPANQFANILSIQKVDDKIVTSGIATEFSIENVFWCDTDGIAIPSSDNELECVMCGDQMKSVGWVESDDSNKDVEIAKMLEPLMQKAAHDPMDDEDDEDMMDKQTISSENTPSKNPTQGNPGGVSRSMRRKKKRIFKADPSDISSGDFVAYAVNKNPQPTQYAKGKVESIKTSGSVKIRGTQEMMRATAENPVAIIRVYRETDGGKFVPTDRRVAKNVSSLRKLKPVMNKAASSRDSRLRELVSQHNEKYGNVNSKRVTLSMLQAVYDRGIGAYRTNPSSVRPNVASAEQWALARVNGFLYAVRTGRFKRTAYDTDLLPKGHPLASKGKKSKTEKSLITNKEEGGVEVAENTEAQENLEAAEAPEEIGEVEFELEESIEEVEEAVDEPEAELALAKSDSEVEAQAEDTSEQTFSLEKVLDEVKGLLEETIQKSAESKSEGLSEISNAISELAKSLDEKVGGLQSKYDELTKSLADLNGTTEQLAARVETVEEDTALKKSGELENSIPEQPVMRKSLWGGRFLNSAEIFN